MLDTFGDTPGDEKIEVSLNHRTFIILKNPGHPTVAVLCIVGAPGTRNDFALVDIEPGEGNAIHVYLDGPKECVFVRSLPVAELEEYHRGQARRAKNWRPSKS